MRISGRELLRACGGRAAGFCKTSELYAQLREAKADGEDESEGERGGEFKVISQSCGLAVACSRDDGILGRAWRRVARGEGLCWPCPVEHR